MCHDGNAFTPVLFHPPLLSDSWVTLLSKRLAKPAYAAPGEAKFLGSYATFSGTLRATQFIDNDHNAYYLDPNATGTSVNIAGSINFKGKILENGTEIFSGMIAAFTGACPTGWTEYTAARGRYVVGTPSAGTGAGTVGTALTNLENRPTGQHNHTITDPGHRHSAGYILYPGGSTNYWNIGANYQGATGTDLDYSATTGITINNAGSVAGTNAPYIQLTYCQKNAGADVAEWTPSSKKVEKNNIVSINPDKTEDVIVTTKEYDLKAIGVVSSAPGWLIGNENKNSIQMALTGRVPTNVTLKNGPIEPGDPIATSTIPGTGMKATKAGPIIGKAMESFDATSSAHDCQDPATGKTEQCGTILVFVTTSWYDPDVYIPTIDTLTIVRNQSGNYQVTNTARNSSIVDRIGAFGQIAAATIKAGYIQTQKLILDDIDVAAKLSELSARIDRQDQIIRELQTEIRQSGANN